MTYQYTIITDGEYTRLATNDAQLGYVELRHDGEANEAAYQETLHEGLEDMKAQEIFYQMHQPNFTTNFRDEVYMNGEVKRTDYSCDRPEAMTQINRLVEAFPEYTADQLTASGENVIGSYGAYRPPYNEDSISFYYFSHPTTTVLEAYGCTTETYGNDLMGWHGIKHGMETLTKSAKFVFQQMHGTYVANQPTALPTQRIIYYARIHNVDGSVEPYVDVYMVSTNQYMRDWCTANNLTFPLPDDVTQNAWFFSVIFNEETGVMSDVKAYIRHSYD